MIPLNVIHKAVCDFHLLDKKELFIKTRKRDIVEPRQIFHYLATRLNKSLYSTNTIGRYYHKESGVKWSHCAVLYSIKTVENLIETDKSFRCRLEMIIEKANEYSFKKAV